MKKLFGNDTFTAMFELCQKRPSHWPPFQPYVPDVSGVNGKLLCLYSIQVFLHVVCLKSLRVILM